MTNAFEQPDIFKEWVSESFERPDVFNEWVTKLFERFDVSNESHVIFQIKSMDWAMHCTICDLNTNDNLSAVRKLTVIQ